MLLQDLYSGEELKLQAKWGGMEYNLASKVEYVEAERILVNTYQYAGQVVDFGAPSFRGIVINVYVDNHNGKRYFWPDVSLKVVKKDNKSYYEISTSAFKLYAKEGERRVKDRLLLNKLCTINFYGEDDVYSGTVKDISQVGVGFYCDQDIDVEGKLIEIEFDDTVGEHDFKLRVKARKVRIDDSGEKTLYGCRLVDASDDALPYMYLKSIYMNREAKNQEGNK